MQTENLQLAMGDNDVLRVPKLHQNIAIKEKRNELGIIEEVFLVYKISVRRSVSVG